MTVSKTILSGIDLGKGERGRHRLAALQEMASVAGHTFGGKPSIGRLIKSIADQHIEMNAEMKTQWSHDRSAVKIFGDHSPHSIIAESDVVDHYGDVETVFHTLHQLRRQNLLPRPNASESHPFTMKDVTLAEENQTRQCRHWQYGTIYPAHNEWIRGYYHIEDGMAIFTDGTQITLPNQ